MAACTKIELFEGSNAMAAGNKSFTMTLLNGVKQPIRLHVLNLLAVFLESASSFQFVHAGNIRFSCEVSTCQHFEAMHAACCISGHALGNFSSYLSCVGSWSPCFAHACPLPSFLVNFTLIFCRRLWFPLFLFHVRWLQLLDEKPRP